MKIALIAAGEMGAGIGGRLVGRGAVVSTLLAGRSAASRRRAEAAGMTAAEDETALLRDADLVLSVLPPGEALGLARRLAPALAARRGQTAYADCNAVSPAAVREIGALIEAVQAPFVDIGIVGPPPRGETDSPRLYASGPALDRVRPLSELGLDLRLLPGGVGQASALKMAYASITKGFTALGANLGAFDLEPEIAAALNAEFLASQPELTAWLARQGQAVRPKAYRWVNEMEQIADALGDAPGAAICRALARFYEAMATDHEEGRMDRADRAARLLRPL